MGKITYMTVKRYAEIIEKPEQTIYSRIKRGKIFTAPEPGGGRGLLIPICTCPDNFFPGKDLCPDCSDAFAKTLKK